MGKWRKNGRRVRPEGTFQGLLLEESAGNQDSDMLCSLLDLFVTQRMEKKHRKLVLVLDNCRYPTSLFLLLGHQASHLARFSLLAFPKVTSS